MPSEFMKVLVAQEVQTPYSQEAQLGSELVLFTSGTHKLPDRT